MRIEPSRANYFRRSQRCWSIFIILSFFFCCQSSFIPEDRTSLDQGDLSALGLMAFAPPGSSGSTSFYACRTYPVNYSGSDGRDYSCGFDSDTHRLNCDVTGSATGSVTYHFNSTADAISESLLSREHFHTKVDTLTPQTVTVVYDSDMVVTSWTSIGVPTITFTVTAYDASLRRTSANCDTSGTETNIYDYSNGTTTRVFDNCNGVNLTQVYTYGQGSSTMERGQLTSFVQSGVINTSTTYTYNAIGSLCGYTNTNPYPDD